MEGKNQAMSSSFIEGDDLHGIRHWMQVYPNLVPRFRVYRYIGTNVDTGLHYFREVNSTTIIFKSNYQLEAGDFRPFCFNSERLESKE